MINLYPPKRLCEIDIINLAARDKAAFVAWCEESYKKRIEHLCATIIAGRFKVIMLTGPSSCGKTTTSLRIASKFHSMGVESRVVSLDNFFRAQEEYPTLPDGTKDFESIETIDIPELTKCISEIVETGETQLPVYDFFAGARRAEREPFVLKDGVVIVEGIHALNPRITSNFGDIDLFKVYLSMREEYCLNGKRLLPTIDMRLARRIVRDNQFRGYTPQKTLAIWSNVCDGELKYIKRYKPEADYLLDTAHSYEPCLIAPLLEELNIDEIENIDHANLFEALRERYRLFLPIIKSEIPVDSLLREFVGE